MKPRDLIMKHQNSELSRSADRLYDVSTSFVRAPYQARLQQSVSTTHSSFIKLDRRMKMINKLRLFSDSFVSKGSVCPNPNDRTSIQTTIKGKGFLKFTPTYLGSSILFFKECEKLLRVKYKGSFETRKVILDIYQDPHIGIERCNPSAMIRMHHSGALRSGGKIGPVLSVLQQISWRRWYDENTRSNPVHIMESSMGSETDGAYSIGYDAFICTEDLLTRPLTVLDQDTIHLDCFISPFRNYNSWFDVAYVGDTSSCLKRWDSDILASINDVLCAARDTLLGVILDLGVINADQLTHIYNHCSVVPGRKAFDPSLGLGPDSASSHKYSNVPLFQPATLSKWSNKYEKRYGINSEF